MLTLTVKFVFEDGEGKIHESKMPFHAPTYEDAYMQAVEYAKGECKKKDWLLVKTEIEDCVDCRN